MGESGIFLGKIGKEEILYFPESSFTGIYVRKPNGQTDVLQKYVGQAKSRFPNSANAVRDYIEKRIPDANSKRVLNAIFNVDSSPAKKTFLNEIERLEVEALSEDKELGDKLKDVYSGKNPEILEALFGIDFQAANKAFWVLAGDSSMTRYASNKFVSEALFEGWKPGAENTVPLLVERAKQVAHETKQALLKEKYGEKETTQTDLTAFNEIPAEILSDLLSKVNKVEDLLRLKTLYPSLEKVETVRFEQEYIEVTDKQGNITVRIDKAPLLSDVLSEKLKGDVNLSIEVNALAKIKDIDEFRKILFTMEQLSIEKIRKLVETIKKMPETTIEDIIQLNRINELENKHSEGLTVVEYYELMTLRLKSKYSVFFFDDIILLEGTEISGEMTFNNGDLELYINMIDNKIDTQNRPKGREKYSSYKLLLKKLDNLALAIGASSITIKGMALNPHKAKTPFIEAGYEIHKEGAILVRTKKIR